MFKKFLYLEWKQFTRSASFGTNLALKIILGSVAIIYSFLLLAGGIALFYALKKMNLDPLHQLNKFLIYYFALDLGVRFLMQKIPVLNIRPLLNLPFKKSTIVNFSLGKTGLSFFNSIHFFFFFPFTIVLLIEGFDIISVLTWHLAMFSLIYINNFLNIIINNKDSLFVVFLVVISVFAGCQYYAVFNITDYTVIFFDNSGAEKRSSFLQ